MTKKKFYAVAVGKVPGIYSDWPTAEAQVKGWAGAKYKGFATYAEAQAWLADPVYSRRAPEKRPDTERQVAAVPPDQIDGVVVYTDGGCLNNPGPGGYGIVIVDGGDVREHRGGFRLTTNNRMELMACVVALRELAGTDGNVILHSDSSYVVNGIEKGWARGWRARGWRKSDGQPALNADLWAELLKLSESLSVSFRWVRGHAGNAGNERCDILATSAARGTQLPVDSGYEQTT